MKHIRLFENYPDFENVKDSIVKPAVAFIENGSIVEYLYDGQQGGGGSDEPEVDYPKQYLTFEAIEDSTFKLTRNACEYSLDEGETWVSLTAETDTPTVSTGSKIMFKAMNPTISGASGIGTFSSTGKFNVEGNVMSMLYSDDFVDKNDLTDKNRAFSRLFYKCTNVVEVHRLILPATTLSDSCYSSMFQDCSSLTTAPELPATTLAEKCYNSMFIYCNSLTTAPELPATTLADYCYASMFNNCKSLTIAPELPATTLAIHCYSQMFFNCISLTTAPELPVTKLASNCYQSMFEGCTSLTEAPELPATTLADWCYTGMFSYCTGLTTAPDLPATTLVKSCYYNMFIGCRNLNNIKMLATNIIASDCLKDWVKNVASTGTFTKSARMTMAALPSGTSGIPSGWTVIDAEI